MLLASGVLNYVDSIDTVDTLTASMGIQLMSDYPCSLFPPLMYVATTFLASSGVNGFQPNVSIVYKDILETWSSDNHSLSSTSSSVTVTATATDLVAEQASGTELSGTSSSQSISNESVPPTLTNFNYYNESAAAAEWSHFYDLILSWQGICLIAVFSTFIVVTVIGNTLVILAVLTTRRLRTVTNCFVMSLAVADLLVGIFVMPPAVAVHLIGKYVGLRLVHVHVNIQLTDVSLFAGSWQLGWVLCDIWISFDVLLCTASILSLCAISVDR